MTELSDLPEVTEAGVSDDDLVLVFDNGASSDKSRKCTRENFLHDVVRTAGEYDVETLNATVALNAPEGAINELTTSKIIIGADVTKVLVLSDSVLIPEATAGVQVSATVALPGALTGDMVTVHVGSSFPAGLIVRATVTASDVVTVYAFNSTASTIAAATHSLNLLLIRAS